MSNNMVEIIIPSSAEFLSIARLALSGVAAKLPFSIEDIEELKIALSEAVSNSIQHGYNQDKSQKIHVSCGISDNALEIVVKDTGTGFDPKTLDKKRKEPSPENNFSLGLGLTFIKNLMDDVQVNSSEGNGTEVTMIKKCVPSPTAVIN